MSKDVVAGKAPPSSSESVDSKQKPPKVSVQKKPESGLVPQDKLENFQSKIKESVQAKAPAEVTGTPTSILSPSGLETGITLKGSAGKKGLPSPTSASTGKITDKERLGRVEVILFEDGFTQTTIEGVITGRHLHSQIYRALLKEFTKYRARRSGAMKTRELEQKKLEKGEKK